MDKDDVYYRIVMSNPIPDKLFRNLRLAPLTKRRRDYKHVAMSPQRYETLKYVARGFTNPQIAEALGVGIETVRSFVKELYDYFDMVASSANYGQRQRLVARCYRERIVLCGVMLNYTRA